MKFRSIFTAAAGAAAMTAMAALLVTTSSPAFARPPGPPPGFHGGPGFHRPPPTPPAFRRPPPPPRHHYRSHWHDWGFWGPLALGGIIIGADLYTRPDRVEVVPVPVPQTTTPIEPASPGTPAKQYAWYWCPTAQGFYPGVATCPVEWQVIMGTSATNPPAPPQ